MSGTAEHSEHREPSGRPEASRTLVLGGDVGGTKTNLGLFRPGPGGPRLLRGGHYASADFPGLAPLIAELLQGDASAVAAACFGVPGPVVDNYTQTPNLAWEIDGERLAAESGIPRLRLVNDLVATAEGIPLLAAEDFALLHPGDPGARGNRALIAAGTGLGMALIPLVGGEPAPVASEGGHMDFAPRDEEEAALLATLRRRFGHVSVERVVSGQGLEHIYEHLRDRSGGAGEAARPGSPGFPARPDSPEAPSPPDPPGPHDPHDPPDPPEAPGPPGQHNPPDSPNPPSRPEAPDPYDPLGPPDPDVERALREGGDAARVISEGALAGRCRLCVRALALLVSAYGAAAGNLALVGTATGGVYLGGGIAPKILPALQDGTFVRAFVDKGRFRAYLEAIPVRVILNDRAAMFGAGRLAARLLAG